MSGQEEGRPHDGPETAENAFALAFPKGDESFPVLKAFQEFLDAERERARRRQMTLTICFMSAIVLLVVLFCVIGAVLFSGMMRRSDTQQAQMLDILMQRMPAPVAQAPALQPAPQPVVAAQPDPQVSELLEVIKSLQAQNVEMMSALQERIREPEPKVAPSAEAAAQARKTGIYSSPRRKPEPAPEQPRPAAEDVAEPDATAAAAEAPEAPAVEDKPGAEESPAAPAGPVKVKIVRTRDMHSPAGYSPEQITIVSSGNVKFPWRVLMPTGTNTQEAMR
jgi:chemotaxis protein histidine kinase CheA